jgi:hypothetical protein
MRRCIHPIRVHDHDDSLLALIHLLKPLTALKLVKTPTARVDCGNCRRACPMDIKAVDFYFALVSGFFSPKAIPGSLFRFRLNYGFPRLPIGISALIVRSMQQQGRIFRGRRKSCWVWTCQPPPWRP